MPGSREARSDERRLRRRERKRSDAGAGEALDGRRAYVAAQAVLEQGLDLWKMADNKARLALMLLGPLNVVLLILLSNREVFADLPPRETTWILIGLFAYVGLGMTMFMLAIGTLRPEEAAPIIGEAPRGGRHAPLGIRHYEDVLAWELDDYQRAWRSVSREQLVEEVAEQAHAVAKANRRKFRALYFLFRGLQGMTALALLLVFSIALGLYLDGQIPALRLKHGVRVRVPARHDAARGLSRDAPHGRTAHGS
jgi:hypothetical protein